MCLRLRPSLRCFSLPWWCHNCWRSWEWAWGVKAMKRDDAFEISFGCDSHLSEPWRRCEIRRVGVWILLWRLRDQTVMLYVTLWVSRLCDPTLNPTDLWPNALRLHDTFRAVCLGTITEELRVTLKYPNDKMENFCLLVNPHLQTHQSHVTSLGYQRLDDCPSLFTLVFPLRVCLRCRRDSQARRRQNLRRARVWAQCDSGEELLRWELLDASDPCRWSLCLWSLPAQQPAATWSPRPPVCPTPDCVPHGAVPSAEVQHHVGRLSDPRRGVNPIFLFCYQNRDMAAIAHMCSWRRIQGGSVEKLNRHFTDVWLIGRSVSKHYQIGLLENKQPCEAFLGAGGREKALWRWLQME